MSSRISRRNFFNKTVSLSTGALLLKYMPAFGAQKKGIMPMIVTSHANKTGQNAMEAGWKILAGGGTALDAIEKAANIIELDPEDTSVGYGGLPNENGIVQLDASIMDGKTYNAGAVACLENIKNPASVARVVMERTDHVLMVGQGALDFAKKWGFKEEDLLTEKARKTWLRWKENQSENDVWGPPAHLRDKAKLESYWEGFPEEEFHYGTTNVLAVDMNGNVSGITTTSGWSYKIPGRVGDSPIIGAGLYVDNEVGAAGATGRGEDVLKSLASYFMVLRMKDGRTPQEACEDALEMIIDKYKSIGSDYLPGEKFIAINKLGETGCATMRRREKPKMSVMTGKGYTKYEGTIARPVK
ncbi:MAG: N(4)-(beta-N-acetylglucosaminyl)-L-asparaginase [Bacteroidota bacterium]|nr:N(4)-(beta-N-acetylglucosaminyl)-L-asparaginase [Bacteroidota bacterium]